MANKATVHGRWRSMVLCMAVLAAMAVPGCSRPEGGPPRAGGRGGGGGGAPQGPPPALVRLGAVSQQELASRWEVVGRLREVRRVTVAAEQSGKLVEVIAERGLPVKQGQAIARIENVWAQVALREAQAQLAQAQAQVVEAEARLDKSRSDLQYLEEIAKAGSARPREVTNARSQVQADLAQLEAARAAVLGAQAQLERRQTEAGKLDVVAPFDGAVVEKMVEVGRWVSQGTPIAEIVSRGEIDAVVDVPEFLVNTIQPGQAIEVQVEPLNTTMPGVVEAVVPAGSNSARTFPVRIRLKDGEGRLKSGMSVTAKIPTTQMQTVLTVPRDAVLRTGTGTVVWASVNNMAMPISVEVLFGAGDSYAVRVTPNNAGPPLAVNMPVVIEGAERLFPMRPLNPMAPGGAPSETGPAETRPASQASRAG